MRRTHATRAAVGGRGGRAKRSWHGARRCGRRLRFESLEPRLVLDALPIISEFMAANKTGLTDTNGNRWDWIEVYNPSDASVVLGPNGTTAAWELQCGGDSWSFPSGYTLAAHEFKIIYAAGSSPAATPSGTWADFKLSKSGETLKLVEPSGQTAFQYAPYPTQQDDISYGVGQTVVGSEIVDSSTNYYFSTATPGAVNSQTYWYHVEDTSFSTDRGFYTTSFALTMATETAGATIRYTLNGSEPSDTGRVKSVAMLTRSSTTATAYSPSDGLTAGSSVRISGAEQAAYNGTFTVAGVTTDTFTFTVSGSPTTPATGVIKVVLDKLRTVSSITRSGTTATVTTSAAHGYSVGNYVQIAGASQSAYNGVFQIVSVPTTTTFTYAVAGSPTTPATGSMTVDLDNTLAVSSITRSSTTATVTTSAAHGYAVGDWVQIAGADQTGYNGVFQIATVPTTTTFTYTVSGSPTTPATGTMSAQGTCLTYTGPLTISKTSTVRAAAYKKGYAPTDVDTQTYLFLADIVTQSSTGTAPAGWPTGTSINGQTMDYGMDPDIVSSATWGAYVQSALTSIPTISMVTAVPNLLNASSGIYVNASKEGEQWERPASIELIYPDGTEGFQIDAGVRLRGGTHGSAGSNPKHAFRLFFKSQYGDSQLVYPLFGEDGVDTFDKLDLRCSSNMSWASEGSSNDAMIREEFFRATQLAMGDLSTHSRFYHLYIDGQYWGLYQSEERPEASFAADYLGGDEADYDVIKASASHTVEATDGTLTAWQTLWNMAQSGFASDTTYYHAQGLDPTTKARDTSYPVYLDVDNLIDYMITILYSGDKDAPISAMLGNSQINNWYGIWNHDGETGFQFIRHDAEITMSQGETNRNGPYSCGYSSFNYSNPQYLHEELMANAEYRMRFADRAHKFLTHDGALASTAAIARFKAEAEELGYSVTNGGAVVAESARWGDSKVTTPLTKNTWLSAVNNEINNFLPTRATVLLTQFKSTVLPSWRGGTSAPLYPSVTAPDFNQWGGTIAAGFALTMTGQGTIYYSLDGTDPRLPGGSIRSGAKTYSGAVTLNTSTHVLARSYSGGTWSALSEVMFTVDLAGSVRISEVMYHPAAATTAEQAAGYTTSDFEYVELKNVGTQTVPLAYLALTDGVTFTFPTYVPGSTTTLLTLAPSAFVVVVANEAAFRLRYPSFSGVIAGTYIEVLSDSGETIELDGPSGTVIQEFTFSDGWYAITDGEDFSLTVRNPSQALGLWDTSDGWRASTAPGGSPGYDDTLATPGSVVINEVLAHSDAATGDVIELHNTSSAAVDVSGWFLSDDADDLMKYQIRAGTSIPAGGYLVFTQAANFGLAASDTGRLSGFGLSEYGDVVYLSSPAVVDGATVPGGYREHVDFGATPSGYSMGLYEKSTGATDFTLLATLTFGTLSGSTYPGAANSDPFPSPLVINEIMYHPAAASTTEAAAGYTTEDFEFVELYNRSGAAIKFNPNPYTNLSANRYGVTGGIGYTFGWLPADLLSGTVSAAWTLEAGATATWTASGLGSNTYEVYATYKLNDPLGDARELDDIAQYTITAASGSTTVTINQDDTYDRTLDADSTLWVDLGAYTFSGTGSVVLTRNALAGQADATIAGRIVFRRSGASDIVVTTPTVNSPFIQSGTTSLAAGGCLVIASNEDAFNLRYSNSDGHIFVAGTYSGQLSDSGDQINLNEYEVTDADSTNGFIPAYKYDHVDFGTGLPNWPNEPDGSGPSLERQAPGEYANDPANWAASVDFGTPGSTTGVADTTPPTVAITAVSPDPRNAVVSTMTIVFSEVVTGFDLSDLTLKRDSGSNLLTSSQSLTTSDNITWTLTNLSSLTATTGTYLLTLTASGAAITDTASNALAADATETWVLAVSSHPWQNATLPQDVNADTIVAPIDALLVINRINAGGVGALPVPPTSDNRPPPYVDVSGDDALAPIDALLVINYINAATSSGEGEGEAAEARLGLDTAAALAGAAQTMAGSGSSGASAATPWLRIDADAEEYGFVDDVSPPAAARRDASAEQVLTAARSADFEDLLAQLAEDVAPLLGRRWPA